MSGIKEYLDYMEEIAREEAEWNFPTEADYCSTTTDTEVENPATQDEKVSSEPDIAEELPTKPGE